MSRRTFWKRLFVFLLSLGILALGLPQLVMFQKARNKILDLEALPEKPVALVLGASVYGRSPSTVLYDRVVSAAELYHAGKVRKLLMSGDNSEEYYNEAEVMKQTALELQVPEADIVLDYAGFRTFDSCARAELIFGLEEVIVVTQRFHLPRALYLCEKFGLTAFGYAADRNVYEKQNFNHWREFWARTGAFFEINFFAHDPKFLGERIEIFENEESELFETLEN